VKVPCRDAGATEALGAALGAACRGGELIRVAGVLGAGKTVLAKGVARGLGIEGAKVTSPTFTLLAVHQGRLPFYHVDLYRVAGPDEIAHLGLFEEVAGPGVTLVEWPARGGTQVPQGGLEVTIDDAGGGARRVALAADPEHAHLMRAAAAFVSAA